MNAQRQDKLVLHAKVGVAGRYRLRVGKRGQKPRIDTGWFDNLVTDVGLDFMGSGFNWLDACKVGSGTATPTAGDTALASFVAGTTTQEVVNVTAQASPPWYGSTTITYRFAEGVAAGNLSEVGIGTDPEAITGTLFSRALITDSNGNPTTITVLSDELLDVTYQIQLVPPTTDTTFNVTDSGPNGTVHTVTLRASNVDTASGTSSWSVGSNGFEVEIPATSIAVKAWSGALGTIDAGPSGSQGNSTSIVTDAYVGSSLERTGTATFGLSAANFNIAALQFVFSGAGTWQAGFDPVIPKTSTKTLAFDLKVSWTRTTAL